MEGCNPGVFEHAQLACGDRTVDDKPRPQQSRAGLIEEALNRAAFDQRFKRTGPVRVLLVLEQHRNRRSGACFPGVDKIAADSRLNDRGSVRRSVRACERAGVVKREYRRSRRGGRQASTRYHLRGQTLLHRVTKVATGHLAVYAALLGRMVFKTGTVEATSQDIADDAGVALWRIPETMKGLQELGYIREDGDLWRLLGFEALTHIRPPGDAQMRPPGAHTSAPLADTHPPPEPSDLEPSDLEHPLTPGGYVSGSLDLRRKRRRRSIDEQVLDEGADPRVVAALMSIVTGLKVGAGADRVSFIVGMTNGLREFTTEVLESVAAAMLRSRSVWPSFAQMHAACSRAADPTIETLHWKATTDQPAKCTLTLDDDARSAFARLSVNWRPVDANRVRYSIDDIATEFRRATLRFGEPVAGRELLQKIHAWVESEQPRVRLLDAEAAVEAAREARREAEEIEVGRAAADLEQWCLGHVENGTAEDDILAVVSSSGLPPREINRLRSLVANTNRRKRREHSGRWHASGWQRSTDREALCMLTRTHIPTGTINEHASH